MAGKGLSRPVRLWRKAHQPLAENWLPWKGSVSVRVPWVLSLRLMRLWRRIQLEKLKIGEMQEWLNWLPWKGSVSVRVPWVRIPLSPLNCQTCPPLAENKKISARTFFLASGKFFLWNKRSQATFSSHSSV
jgi:hypothetical protein